MNEREAKRKGNWQTNGKEEGDLLRYEDVDPEYVPDIEVERENFESGKERIHVMEVSEGEFDFPSEDDVVAMLQGIAEFLDNDIDDWDPHEVDVCMMHFLEKCLQRFRSPNMTRVVFRVYMRLSTGKINDVTIRLVDPCFALLLEMPEYVDTYTFGIALVAVVNAMTDEYSRELVLSKRPYELAIALLQRQDPHDEEQVQMMTYLLSLVENYIPIMLERDADISDFVIPLMLSCITLFREIPMEGASHMTVTQCLKIFEVVLKYETYLDILITEVPNLGEIIMAKMPFYKPCDFEIVAGLFGFLIQLGKCEIFNDPYFFTFLKDGFFDRVLNESIKGILELLARLCKPCFDMVISCGALQTLCRTASTLPYSLKPGAVAVISEAIIHAPPQSLRTLIPPDIISLLIDELQIQTHESVNQIGNALMKLTDSDPEYYDMSPFQPDLELILTTCSDEQIACKLAIIYKYLFSE